MNFFEQAHVVKTDNAKKDYKSEENMKKQLKQMLHGYKRGDTKLIKQAGSREIDYDDLNDSFDNSPSVSGFSDLNLTNSSTDGDNILDPPTNDSLLIYKTEESNQISLVSNEESQESFEADIDSIPEESEYTISFVSENTREISNNLNTDSGTLSFSDLDKETHSELSSSDFEFDRDGDLASKILKKLGKSKEKSSQGRKRKLHTDTNNIIDANVKLLNTDKHLDLSETNILPEAYDRQIIDKFESNDSLNLSQDCSTTSSQFVSITVENMPDQSLSEILGEYRYSTIKNLPSDKQNIINSSLFSTKSDILADVEVEEDIDSLIPELGEEPTVEDLEMDLEVDLQLPITIDDSIITIDNSIVSDNKTQSEESFIDMHDSEQTDNIDTVIPVNVYHGKKMCILIMKHPSKIYVHGRVRITVLCGTIEVFGYTLKNDYYDLYAPNYNCAQCIQTVESRDMYYGLFSKLTSSGLSVKDAEEIVTTLDNNATVVHLSLSTSHNMNFVENNFKTADLFSKLNKNIDDCFKKASEILGCSLYLMPPLRCYEVNSNWEEVINYGHDESKLVVCGGKGSGKSTFLRYYVNKLLANGPVLVIDLDPGQAEFTVAGNVSATVVTTPLLGPSFTHLTSPDLMLNIGMISTMDNPIRYVNAVTDVIAYCRNNEKYKRMPWVINTMGMTNNMGLKFITLIIMLIQPTYVLQIDYKNNKKGYGTQLHPVVVKNLFKEFKNDRLFKDVVNFELSYKFFMCGFKTNEVKSMSLAAKDERYLNFLAYFGQLLDVHGGPELLSIDPYEVKLCNLNVGVNVYIPKDAVTKVINGKIIALCQLTASDKGGVFVLGDKAVHCLGLGLVRGVDFEKGVLYVITPASIHTLVLVNTLVYNDWVPELTGQEMSFPKGTAIPYRASSVHQQKELMVVPRRRYNPMLLFKLKG